MHTFRRKVETKARLNTLDEAEEHRGGKLRGGVEDAWVALQESLQDVVSNFEGKHS